MDEDEELPTPEFDSRTMYAVTLRGDQLQHVWEAVVVAHEAQSDPRWITELRDTLVVLSKATDL